MTPDEMIERIMSAHWDIAACQCWICEGGRKLGLHNRKRYIDEQREYPVSEFGFSRKLQRRETP